MTRPVFIYKSSDEASSASSQLPFGVMSTERGIEYYRYALCIRGENGFSHLFRVRNEFAKSFQAKMKCDLEEYGISIVPSLSKEGALEWRLSVKGPSGSPYEGC